MTSAEDKGKRWRKAPTLGLLGLLALLFACFGLLALVPDLRPAVPEVLGLTALATLIVAILFHGIRKGWGGVSPATILVVAAGLRLLFLFDAPQLSDDIYRYLFDGSRILAGHNPYADAPEKVARDDRSRVKWVTDVNHPHLITIYPPGAQVIFTVGALWQSVVGMKAVLILLDLLCIGVMMRLLSKLGLAPNRVIIYAWHPLAVLEIASSGHIDGAAMMFLFAAIHLLWPRAAWGHALSLPGSAFSQGEIGSQGRRADFIAQPTHRKDRGPVFFSGFLFSFAILVKLLPIVFLPLCWGLVRRDLRIDFLFGLVMGSFSLIFPFYPDIRNALSTLGVYTVTWEFSGLAFHFLRSLFSSGMWARITLGLVFAIVWLYCYRQAVPAEKEQSISERKRFEDAIKAIYLVAFVFLMVTPTLHPWYGLYMLGFLPFFPNPAGMILSWTILLGYRVLIPYSILNQWVEEGSAALMIWIGPMAALVISAVLRHRAVRNDKCQNPNVK